MKRYLNRTILAVPILLALLVSTTVLADRAYHSERLDFTLTAAGDADGHPELRHGQVVNIHPNGPVVGALERYMVSGAMPNTIYKVRLDVFGIVDELGCDGTLDLQLPTGELETNGGGVGHHQAFFGPTDIGGFSGLTLGVIWNLEAGGVDAYNTACTTVVID